MKISYDGDADALYIEIRNSKVESTKELDENTMIDYDSEGKVIGFELLFVKERSPEILKDFKIENIAVV